MSKRILSGINPSSSNGLHLGNYLGAVKQHVEFQQQGECYFFVANLHALNTVYDPGVMISNTIGTYLDYMALGMNPEKTTFYVESDIPAIRLLQTIINNCVTVGEMQRMHAYKDKLSKETSQESISMGLFNYPILMAADILVFDADIVPVGKDQSQHVEICREIGQTFNRRYGNVLKLPELYVKQDVAAVLGTDGERKMSKTLGNDITIFADEKTLHKQIFSTVTDRNRIHPTDPGDPAKNVLFSYMRFLDFDAGTLADFESRYRSGTVGDVEIKKAFYEHFLDYFKTHRERRNELAKDLGTIAQIRRTAAERANRVANQTLARVQKAVGLGY